MNAFDKIIGYETIKRELYQICDMIHYPGIYQGLGAKIPNGLMLYGEPGVGKSLMAKALIEACEIPFYIVRKNKNSNDFINSISEAFQKAKNADTFSIVFLDDMDKFANEDSDHCNASEYVAVQAGIDDVRDCNVFVLATVNDLYKLPESLRRSGRFDRIIEVKCPCESDALAIIRHYLKGKPVNPNISLEDLAKMMSSSSCAKLENILNEAAITAAYNRKALIEMDDIVRAMLGIHYSSRDSHCEADEEEIRKTAMHEAGHIVMCEALCPGSVGLAAVHITGDNSVSGFVHRCKEGFSEPRQILALLAGKAAVELYFADSVADGCYADIDDACRRIQLAIAKNADRGFEFLDVASHRFSGPSESLNSRIEFAIQAELDRYFLKSRDILLKNRAFLEVAAAQLAEKKILLHSDIQKIRNSVIVRDASI